MEYQIKFPSQPESIIQVETLVEEIKGKYAVSDEVFGNMLVALTEAVNNAIVHGNKKDTSKTVALAAGKQAGVITFIIKDEGPGFDYNGLPDPTAPENLEKPTGRGVFLMKHLSDMVIFSDKGRTVELQFKV